MAKKEMKQPEQARKKNASSRDKHGDEYAKTIVTETKGSAKADSDTNA